MKPLFYSLYCIVYMKKLTQKLVFKFRIRSQNEKKAERFFRDLATVWTSVADPERFDADADPDPTFQADADLDPKFVARDRKKFQNFFFVFSIILQNMSCVLFSVIIREELGLGVRDEAMRGEGWGRKGEGHRWWGDGERARNQRWGVGEKGWGGRLRD